MTLIDLDAAKAARREASAAAVSFKFAGETFDLPVELPLPAENLVAEAKAEKWDDRRFLEAFLKGLLGETEWSRFWALNPSYGDLGELFDQAMRAYGATAGESSPSASSSKRAGGSSKPNSRGSTTRTRERTSRAAAPGGSSTGSRTPRRTRH